MPDLTALALDTEYSTPDGGARRVRLVQDQDCDSPRDYDFNIAVITTHTDERRNHPQENPDRKVEEGLERYSNRRVVARWLRLCHGATVVLPLYNGSNGVLSPGSANETQWGGIGIVYDTPASRACMGENPSPEDVERAIRAELDEYNAWVQGECYGYVVEGHGKPCSTCDGEPEWEHLDSCWGYIGHDYATEAALDALRVELDFATSPAENPTASPETTAGGNAAAPTDTAAPVDVQPEYNYYRAEFAKTGDGMEFYHLKVTSDVGATRTMNISQAQRDAILESLMRTETP